MSYIRNYFFYNIVYGKIKCNSGFHRNYSIISQIKDVYQIKIARHKLPGLTGTTISGMLEKWMV